MATDRELKLNSIDRYVKSSPSFVLEEKGHCEVPAGCGGVVLRWRNPMGPVPVRLQLWLSTTAYVATIDGLQPSSSRPLLTPGSHVLMISVTPDEEQSVQLLFSATAELESGAVSISPPLEDWRWTASEPSPDAWEQPKFDTDEWSSLTPTTLSAELTGNYTVSRLLGLNVTPLKTPPRTGSMWIRTAIEVPQGR